MALIACPGRPDQVRVGVDIACVHERDEYRAIEEDGFDTWVSAYADVFSPRELDDIKYRLPSLKISSSQILTAEDLGSASRCCRRNQTFSIRVYNEKEDVVVVDVSSNDIIEAKLRRFYTFWALKEAYVKMTGDALLADWLHQLEFRNVRAPRPVTEDTEHEAHMVKDNRTEDTRMRAVGNDTERKGAQMQDEDWKASILDETEVQNGEKASWVQHASKNTNLQWGENIQDIQAWYNDMPVQDLVLEVQALERDYIMASAVSFADLSANFKELGESTNKASTQRKSLPPFEILNLAKDILPCISSKR